MIVLKQGNNGMEQRKKKKNEKQIHDRVENKEL